MPARKSIEGTMKEEFEEVDLLKTSLATRVNEINKERDEYVNKETKKVVTEEYLKNHYREYEAYIIGRRYQRRIYKWGTFIRTKTRNTCRL